MSRVLKVIVFVLIFIKSQSASKVFLDIPDGTSLEFDYNSETFTGPADSIYGSFTEMKAKIFLWKYDIHHMEVLIKDATSVRHNKVERNPTSTDPIQIKDTHFLIVYSEEMQVNGIKIAKETSYPANFLTSIASLFQMNLNVVPSKQPETTDFKTGSENTIYGNCSINYQIKPLTHDSFSMENSYNPEKCSEFKSSLYSTIELTNEECWDKERDSIIQMDNRRTYEFKTLPNEIHIKKIESIQTILLHPFQENGLIFATKINQTMSFVSKNLEIPKGVEIINPNETSNVFVDLVFTNTQSSVRSFPSISRSKKYRENPDFPEQIRKDILSYLKDAEQFLGNNDPKPNDEGNSISKLIDLMKMFEEPDFEYYLNEIKANNSGFGKKFEMLYFGLTASVGSQASLQFILDSYNKNQLDDENLLKNVFMSLSVSSRVPNMDLQMINPDKSASEDLRAIFSLMLSNIMDKVKSTDVDLKIVPTTIKLLQMVNDYKKQIVLIQMLGNLRATEAVPILSNIISYKLILEPFNENLIVEAMISLKKILKNDKGQLFQIIYPVLSNHKYLKEIRLIALRIIMTNLENKEQGSNLFHLMQLELDSDVYNFYKSSLKELSYRSQCNPSVRRNSEIWRATTKSDLPIGNSISLTYERFNQNLGSGIHLKGLAVFYKKFLDTGVRYISFDVIYYISKMPIKLGSIRVSTPFSRSDPEFHLTVEFGSKVVFSKVYDMDIRSFFDPETQIEISEDLAYVINQFQVEYQIPTDFGTHLEVFANMPIVYKSIFEAYSTLGLINMKLKSLSKVTIPQMWGMKIASPFDESITGIVHSSTVKFNLPFHLKLSLDFSQNMLKYIMDFSRSQEESEKDDISLKLKRITSVYIMENHLINYTDLTVDWNYENVLFEGNLRDLGLDLNVVSNGFPSLSSPSKFFYSPPISEMSKVPLDEAMEMADSDFSDLMNSQSIHHAYFAASLTTNQNFNISKYVISINKIEAYSGEKLVLKYLYSSDRRLLKLVRSEEGRPKQFFCVNFEDPMLFKSFQNDLNIFYGESNEEECVFDQYKAHVSYSMSSLPNSKLEDFPQCVPNPYSKLYIENPKISAVDCAIAMTNIRNIKAVINYDEVPHPLDEYVKTVANWLALTFPARYEYSRKAVKNQVLIDINYPPSLNEEIELKVHTPEGSYIFEHYPAEFEPFNLHFPDMDDRALGLKALKYLEYKTEEYDSNTKTWIYDGKIKFSMKELEHNQLALNITYYGNHYMSIYPSNMKNEKFLITTPANNYEMLGDKQKIIPIQVGDELVISVPRYNSVILYDGYSIQLL